MKKQIISICLFTFITFVYAFDNQALTRETVNEHWKDIAFWEHGISSKLIEPGYNYGWESIDDDDLATAWVEGKKGDGNGTQALAEPSIMHETEIILEDTMNQQIFTFNCSPNASFLEGSLYLYAQLTILDVYPGEKYQDTCISEMKANADVIKENEKNKTSPKKVSQKKK